MITVNPSERKRSVHDLEEDPVFRIFQKRSCMTSTIPDFECECFYENELRTIKLSKIFENYESVVLFFYERDFTVSSVSDIIQVRDHYDAFAQNRSLPIMISTDTVQVHRGFSSSSTIGGLQTPLEFPLVGDSTRLISRQFDVLDNESGNARRSVFVIDNCHKVKYSFMPLDNEQPYSMSVILSMVGNIMNH